MEKIVNKSGESSTGKRCDDEDPDMIKGSGFSGEDEIGEGGGDGTGRVDAGSSEIDADEVDKSQGETDDETGRFLDLGILAGDIEDDIDKDEGEDDLKKQGNAGQCQAGGSVCLHGSADLAAVLCGT